MTAALSAGGVFCGGLLGAATTRAVCSVLLVDLAKSGGAACVGALFAIVLAAGGAIGGVLVGTEWLREAK